MARPSARHCCSSCTGSNVVAAVHQLLALVARLQISLAPEAARAGERLGAGERHPESLDAETLADMKVAVLGCLE